MAIYEAVPKFKLPLYSLIRRDHIDFHSIEEEDKWTMHEKEQ